MLESRISRALLGLGAFVGVVGVGVWALEASPMNLPDWIVRVAMLKLTFVASAGLLAGGALVGRHARQRSIAGAAAARQIAEPVRPISDRPDLITPLGVKRHESDPQA